MRKFSSVAGGLFPPDRFGVFLETRIADDAPACADLGCAAASKVPQVMKFSALENIISSHLGDENIAGERPQDASYADLSHPVADLHRGLFCRICPMRMAFAPAWRAISELQIPQFRAAHLDLWPRSPGILRPRPVPGFVGEFLSGVRGRRSPVCCRVFLRGTPASAQLGRKRAARLRRRVRQF